MGSLASSMPVSDSTLSACDLGLDELRLRACEQHPPRTPTPIDLMEAHRATHALNGALLDLSAAGIGLSLGNTLVGEEAEIWTATLRSDLDGPGGAYALIAPVSMVWGMPGRHLSNSSLSSDARSAALRLSEALRRVAEAGIPIAVRADRRRIVFLANPDAVVESQQVVSLAGGDDKAAPVALRVS